MLFIPHGYQEKAEDHIIENKAAALFLDMGLGKTVTVLTAFNTLKYDFGDVQSMIVVAPLRVAMLTWRQEAQKWDHLKHLRVVLLHGPEKNEALKQKADVYVINYDGLRWLRDMLSREGRSFPIRVDMAAFDESTYIKHQSSERSKIAVALARGVDRNLILTGSPTPNGLLDLWHQIYLLDGGERLGPSFSRFKAEHFIPNDTGNKHFPRRGVSKRIVDRVGDISLTMKAEDYLDMPDVINNDVHVVLPDKLQKQYEKFEQQFFIELGESKVIAFSASALSTKLRQFVQGFMYDKENGATHNVHKLKIEALRDVVDSAGGPVLVAIQFRYEAELLKKEFGDVPVIYGGTSEKETMEYVDRWNMGVGPGILAAHPASMAHGINLQSGGNTIAWLGLPWNLEHYLQFNARLWRQGQGKPVTIHHIVVKDTIDEVVARVLKNKEGSMAKLIERLKEWREYARKDYSKGR